MKRLQLFLPLAGFIVLSIFLLRGLQLDPHELPSALLDKEWPAFSLPTLESGKTVTQKDLYGHKALLNVWATWCVTCRIEHPYLIQLAQQGVLVYGVNYKDKDADAQQWLQTKGNPYRFTIVDADGRLGIDLGVSGAPETYFLDSRGVIRYKHVGDLNEQVWQQKLKAVWDSME